MGLVPSREALYEGQATAAVAAAAPRSLPFISRAVENYTYKTNRTERIFSAGVAPGDGVRGPAPIVLFHGVPARELAELICEVDPNAVFIDDPAEATAAVAASRGSRRAPAKATDGRNGAARGGGGGAAAAVADTAAADALRAGKVPYVYYYEHRVVPLTAAFFPSPDCVLFRQLWHARQQQNPRYHFQLDHTWSPGALTDPTAAYESFAQLAAHSMADIQAACLAASQAATPEAVLQAQQQLQAAVQALRVPSADANDSAGEPRTRVPFATREEFYDLVVRTTEELMLYSSDAELRDAVCAGAGSEVGGEGSAAQRRRLRPVPCAIVLVRRCMPAHEYRHTYYVANNERHHKPNAATAAGAGVESGSGSRRRGGSRTGEADGGGASMNPMRENQSTHILGAAVRYAVQEARAMDQRSAQVARIDEEEMIVPWLQVEAPRAPLGLAEVRVVGMYGCWTVEEVLRRTLFAQRTYGSGGGPRTRSLNAPVEEAKQVALMEEVLRRAAPHGVPSSTLLNTAFFEKQVGDKEQCHTYFALCRLFAQGMRRCILGDSGVLSPHSASVPLSVALSAQASGSTQGVESGPWDAAAPLSVERSSDPGSADPTWQAFLQRLSGSTAPSHAADVLGDLANCFLIRFSNIPQLQLCRQIRLMLTELRAMCPAAPTLEGFQAAQRQRNMAAMAKKGDAVEGPGAGGAALLGPLGRSGKRGSVDGLAATGSLTAERNRIAGASSPSAATPPPPAQTANLSLSLDPDAIAQQRSRQPSEAERYRQDGFCCYASNGLVVFRLSRTAVADALHQLSCAPPHDSVEALCVTLTAAAPPPLTYRGELRPPAHRRARSTAAGKAAGPDGAYDAATRDAEGDDDDGADYGNGEAAAAAEEDAGGTAYRRDSSASQGGAMRGPGGPTSAEALENMYNNALRYTAGAAGGFAMEPLWPVKPECASWASQARALEATPDDLIGVLPRNAIEHRRGRLLPLRSVVAAAVAAGSSPSSTTHPGQRGGAHGGGRHQHHHGNNGNGGGRGGAAMSALLPFQLDVYTVSAELDGVSLRELVELTHQQQQQNQRRRSDSQESMARVMIEAVDADGNVEPDSVLNWSPMAALGSLRWKRALAAAGCPDDAAGAAAASAHAMAAAGAGEGAPASHGVVSIYVHDPDRVLRAGDRIRFGSANGAGTTASVTNTPRTGRGRNSISGSLGGAAAGAAGTPATRIGYWYVDDSLTTEDMVLSWMRRVGGRARETRGTDTKWVRLPESVLQVLLRFANTCREQPGGGWLTTGHVLRNLHPADEELVEPDLLLNFPDILRTRRFRQWRFSHDGYVYFHGVTVRIPGSMPPPSQSPPASNMAGRHSPMHAVAPSTSSQGQFSQTAQNLLPAKVGGSSFGGGSAGREAFLVGAPAGAHGYASPASMNQRPHHAGAQYRDPGVQQPQMALYDQHPQQLQPAQQVSYVVAPAPVVLSMQTAQQPQQRLSAPQHIYVAAAPYPGSGGAYNAAGAATGGIGAHAQMGFYGQAPSLRATPVGSAVGPDGGPKSPETPSVGGGSGAVSGGTLYFHGAHIMQRHPGAMVSSGSNTTPSEFSHGLHRGAPSQLPPPQQPQRGGAAEGFFVDPTDGASFRSSDRAHSTATVLGPAHVSSSFYGELYNTSAPGVLQSPLQPQHLGHSQQQQQQQHVENLRLRSPLTSPANVSAQGGAAWGTESLPTAYGPPPGLAAGGPTSPYDREDGFQAPGQRMAPQHAASAVPPPPRSATVSALQAPQPPRQQQQQQYNQSSHALAPEGDRGGYAAERRSTHDYPPRRTPAAILTTGGMAGSGAPSVRSPNALKLSAPTVRGGNAGAGAGGGQRAAPVASFAPDVVDPSDLGQTAHARSARSPQGRAPGPLSPHSTTGSHPQTPLQHLYRGPHSQAAQSFTGSDAAPPHTPLLASGQGSCRDVVTSEVIEADSITVRVVQRKSFLARQSSYSSGAAGAIAGGHRQGSGTLGDMSGAAGGDGGAASGAQDGASAMGYGAMGVSPSGGLESMREDGGADEHQPHSTRPRQLSPHPTSASRSYGASAASGGGYSGMDYGQPPQRQQQQQQPQYAGGGGYGLPLSQRGSQRVSHNPYSAAGRSPVASPAPASGFFHASGAAAGTGTSPVASQYPSRHASQRVIGETFSFPRGAADQSARGESHHSFYNTTGDVPASGAFSDFCENAATDGTTQGFFFSMGDDEEPGNAAQELYGGTPTTGQNMSRTNTGYQYRGSAHQSRH